MFTYALRERARESERVWVEGERVWVEKEPVWVERERVWVSNHIAAFI